MFNSKSRGVNGNSSPKWCITIPDTYIAPFICENPRVLHGACWGHFTHHGNVAISVVKFTFHSTPVPLHNSGFGNSDNQWTALNGSCESCHRILGGGLGSALLCHLEWNAAGTSSSALTRPPAEAAGPSRAQDAVPVGAGRLHGCWQCPLWFRSRSTNEITLISLGAQSYP